MRIIHSYQGKEEVFESDNSEVHIGRSRAGAAVDLDLHPDMAVSRPHARVWIDTGQYWIEDLNSSHGTRINGQEIKGKGTRPLHPGDTISLGGTTLRVEIPADFDAGKTVLPTPPPPAQEALEIPPSPLPPPPSPPEDPDLTVEEVLAPGAPPVAPGEVTVDTARRLALLYELPLEFAAERRLDSLLQKIVDRLVEVIPDAKRGAILLHDSNHKTLLLKAYHSPDEPAVSQTLARRAMEEGKGIIWSRGEEADIPASAFYHQIETGMYTPLIWQGKVLGVVCVDSPERSSTFSQEDFQLMQAVAHYAAAALANWQLQEDLQREIAVKANLLRHFSPRIAKLLLEQRGRHWLGGNRSHVTVLSTDIRGFTNLTQGMEPGDVVRMLNSYFARLIPILFKYDGTVDKFIGDAILAVFGSPEPDPDQHSKAVRAALEMQSAIALLNAERSRDGAVTCEMGIGIHCGEALHGFIGSEDRLEFTVIGETVNKTARYCDVAHAGEVLISHDLHGRVFGIIKAIKVERFDKHGKALEAHSVKSLKPVQ